MILTLITLITIRTNKIQHGGIKFVFSCHLFIGLSLFLHFWEKHCSNILMSMEIHFSNERLVTNFFKLLKPVVLFRFELFFSFIFFVLFFETFFYGSRSED